MGEPAGEQRTSGGAAVTRAGFVALAGRPNVGKSTLVNAVVGAKVAIVSDRAQTTRRAIRGVRTEGESQIVLVDLPGVQRPRDALTARMAQRVREELQGADAALLLLSGEQGVGPGDRFIARTLAAGAACRWRSRSTRSIGSSRAETLAALQGAADLELEGEVFPISARTGEGVRELVEHLQELLPEGPFLFAVDARSDQPLALLLAELIREAAIRRTFHELPHAVEVVVEEMERRADGPDAGARADLGGERLPEGHLDRCTGADDQGDRQRRAGRAGARARLPSASRSVGAGAPGLAQRRGPARPSGDQMLAIGHAGRRSSSGDDDVGVHGRRCRD